MHDAVSLNIHSYPRWIIYASILLLLISLRLAYAAFATGVLKNVPGPHGRPFIGVGLVQPTLAQLRSWAEDYGEVYSFRLGWYNWVVLNSPEAIKEVMDKQVQYAASQSDRLYLQVTVHLHFIQATAANG